MVRANSRSTPASSWPERFSTWKEWSAVSITRSVARGPSVSQTGRSRFKSARESRSLQEEHGHCHAREVLGAFGVRLPCGKQRKSDKHYSADSFDRLFCHGQ